MTDDVTRQTVVHLQTLAIGQHQKIAEIARHVRDIKYGVVFLIAAVIGIAFRIG